MARTRFTVKEGIAVADDNVVGGYPLIPVGGLMPYAGSTSPEGWLLCDGAAINRTTYANLFALIGTTYGSGNGTTTFNVPDMRSRMPIGTGAGTGLTSRALAATGGAESVVVASGNLPLHQHTIAHTHGVTIASAAFTTAAPNDNTSDGPSVASSGGPNDNTSDGPSDNTSDGATTTDHSHGMKSHTHVNYGTTNSNGGATTALHNHDVKYANDAASGTAKARVTASGGGISSGAVNDASADHNHGNYATLGPNDNTSDNATAGHTHTMKSHTHTMKSHTHGLASHTHTMKNHTHGLASHTHTMKSHSHTYDHGHTGSTDTQSDSNSGNGGFANTALAIMNPFLSVNYIIMY